MRNNLFKSRQELNHEEEPIRGEIYSAERLEEYAGFLSSELVVNFKQRRGRSLLPRFRDNAKSLNHTYQLMTSVIAEGGDLSPSAEWIIDNFHIIEDQIREVKEDLPESYYKELPKVCGGELEDFPRVYAMSLTLVAHLDSLIDIKTVGRFINAYQKTNPLLIGEIWAIPIALRIGLIENLRRIGNRISLCHQIKKEVDELEKLFLENKNSTSLNIEKLVKKLTSMLGKSHFCDCVVIARLSQKFHTRAKEIMPAYDCVDNYLVKNNLKMEEIVRLEHQMQASDQISISNSISTMRLLSNTDWLEFFESISHVDAMLARDPASVYKKMEFSSRDEYLHSIERIHKKTGYGEIEIAKEAVRMATESYKKNEVDFRKHHVGYYLIRKGVRELEKKTGYRPTLKEKIRRLILDHPYLFYIGLFTFFCILLLAPLVSYINWLGYSTTWSVLVAAVALVPASDSALNILNLVITWFVGPFILPKIKLSQGIPDDAKTFVVVPTIVGNLSEVQKLLEDIEIRYLANQENNLYYGLLSDFTDSDFESLSTDYEIIDTLKLGVTELNKKYPSERDQFYFFHRKRMWNPSENKWMGWERKRGKLEEFNSFLRGKKSTSFVEYPDFDDFFQQIKYVITLDTDTKLPRDSALKLIGTILHPLNRPQVNKDTQMVQNGYTILQPRISITPESSGRSLFARIYSGHTGVDPYTTAVSDAYQDLFGEGIFTGKGLYVVDTFEEALKDRVPENTLLSHDLFEGVFARAALVSDIELLDDYPSHFVSFAKREHRWVRGDWQISKWILPSIQNSRGETVENPLSAISRWKIADNLRRSLVAPSTTLLFVLCWSIIPGSSLLWSLILLSVLALPLYAHSASQLLKHPRDLSFEEKLKGVWEDLKMNFYQLLISILTLPYQSFLHVDAILRTLYRINISHKNLLNWSTAAHVEEKVNSSSGRNREVIVWSSVVVTVSAVMIYLYKPNAYLSALPVLLAWISSSVILEKLSKPNIVESGKLNRTDEKILRSIARRTWNFFETYVNEENHWLPPDNFQEEPENIVAHRTSPTNIGLYLLSCCSAYNFGYISLEDLLKRLEQTISTMDKLTKHYGHLYNWYNTLTLEPLVPEYISTVDSGNLAGHLLAVKQTCLDLKVKSFHKPRVFQGLEDIFLVMNEECKKLDSTYTNHLTTSFVDLKTLVSDTLAYLEWFHRVSTNHTEQSLEQVRLRLGLINQKIQNLSNKYGREHYQSISLWSSRAYERLETCIIEIKNFRHDSPLSELEKSFDRIASKCHQMVMEMDFKVLFDEKRKLFPIGYKIREGKYDESYYDLLVSEARLASLVSIAKGDVPENHWFHLGRQMTSLFHERVLISWSASMFEYLMPLLVMKDYIGTLLHETHRSSVRQQVSYGQSRNAPWGLSESAYNSRDIHMNYQYGPFGVPGMGLKRGLSQDYVISPYSTALATMVSLDEAILNFKELIKSNLLTNYGFYEAVDYTESRLPPGEKFVVVKNFMAHHQGMVIVALDNVLHQNVMRKRFHYDPMIKSCELLLQERIPKRISYLHPRSEELSEKHEDRYECLPTLLHIENVNTDIPQTRVISNGNYSVMLTASGGGYSRCEDLAVLRWHADSCLEREGQFFFIRDKASNKLESLTFSPLGQSSKSYRTMFSAHKVEFWMEKENYIVHTEVLISAEDNIELRRLSITNLSDQVQEFDLISYSEPVLSQPERDLAHPAFSKIFLETECVPEKSALLVRRRKSADTDPDLYGLHQIIYDKKVCDQFQFETDRLRFFGRNNDLKKAKGLQHDASLSNSTGTVLDAILALKISLKLKPKESTKVLYCTGLAKSRDEALRLLDQYHDIRVFERVDEMAWTHSQIELRHLNLESEEVNTFQKIAGALLFSSPEIRPASSLIEKNMKNQSYLWTYGISGDIPIMLITINDKHDMKFIQDILQLHEYLRNRHVIFDLVIVSDESTTYRLAIHEEVLHQLRLMGGQNFLNKKGGIFIMRKDLVPESDLILLKAIAKVFLRAKNGSLKTQVDRMLSPKLDNNVVRMGTHESEFDKVKKKAYSA